MSRGLMSYTPRLKPIYMPSFILIHLTVWPQYTNVTDRQDRQTDRHRYDSIGRTVLQTVAQLTVCQVVDSGLRRFKCFVTSKMLIVSDLRQSRVVVNTGRRTSFTALDRHCRGRDRHFTE